LGLDSKADCSVSEREIEIDQQCSLTGLLGQRGCKIAGQGGDSGAAFGAEEYQQPAVFLSRGARSGTEDRGPNQSLCHGAGVEGQSEKLASASAHAAQQQARIGLRGVDHYGCQVARTDRLYQIKRVLRITVQLNQDDIVVIPSIRGTSLRAGG